MKFLFGNILLKLVAIVLAIAVWIFVSGERRERVIERAYDVPIVIIGVPQHLIITTPLQEVVNVRMRGRLSTLRALSSQNLEATLDLKDVRAGDITAIIRPQNVNVPDGTEIVSIVPAKITFRLEERRQKFVPIRPFLVGDPPKPLEIGEVIVNPPNALVSGPSSIVKDFIEASTERVLLSGKKSDVSVNVGVVSDRSLIRIIEPNSARVTVTIVPPDLTEEPADSTSTASSERIAPPVRERAQ